MGSKDAYIVAGTRPWNRRILDQVITRYPGSWHYVSHPDQLTPEWVATVAPATFSSCIGRSVCLRALSAAGSVSVFI